MIADDEWLRVGSANFANRSMGLDTECDLLVEAHGELRTSRAIASCRDRLLGEHLDVPEEAVHEAIEKYGSLCAAIEGLRCEPTRNRTLEPFEQLPEPPAALVAVASLADPERPVQLESSAADARASSASAGMAVVPVAVLLAALAAGLIAFWHSGRAEPLTGALRTIELARWVADDPWLPLLIVLAYTPAAVTLFPRPLITLFSIVALGPRLGFACSFTGMMGAAAVTFFAGRRLDRSLVRRLAGRRLGRVSRFLYDRGTLAIAAVRLAPSAPFAVVNVVAGAMGVRAGRFLAGTALGLLPGTLVATLFGDQLTRWLRNPSSINLGVCAAAIAALVTSAWAVRHWLAMSRDKTGNAATEGTNDRIAAPVR